MTVLVIDSCIAVKWIVEEEDSNLAAVLFDENCIFIAPDYLLAELANVLWKKVRRGEVEVDQAVAALSRLPSYFDEMLEGAGFLSDALRTSIDLNHPTYDCLYLVIAAERKATLVTADKRLGALAETCGVQAIVLGQDIEERLMMLNLSNGVELLKTRLPDIERLSAHYSDVLSGSPGLLVDTIEHRLLKSGSLPLQHVWSMLDGLEQPEKAALIVADGFTDERLGSLLELYRQALNRLQDPEFVDLDVYLLGLLIASPQTIPRLSARLQSRS